MPRDLTEFLFLVNLYTFIEGVNRLIYRGAKMVMCGVKYD